MYKVFFNEQIIYLESEKDNIDNTVEWTKISNREQLPALLFTFFESEEDLFLLSENKDELLNWLAKALNYIEAAGGIVENEDGELLFIYRLDTWDLPKGKIEKGEAPEKAAYREVMEECGIKSHQLKQHLTNTFHIYEMHGKMYLKKTYWFYFLQEDNKEDVVPQTEEDIELVSWFGEDEIQLALLDSYESIREVYQAYQQL